MLTGAHVVVYSKDADADRRFFKDILGFQFVDAGHGWLIFALPAAEVAFHPRDKNNQHEMYFVCDNLKTQMDALKNQGRAFWRNSGRTVGNSHDDFASGRRQDRIV